MVPAELPSLLLAEGVRVTLPVREPQEGSEAFVVPLLFPPDLAPAINTESQVDVKVKQIFRCWLNALRLVVTWFAGH